MILKIINGRAPALIDSQYSTTLRATSYDGNWSSEDLCAYLSGIALVINAHAWSTPMVDILKTTETCTCEAWPYPHLVTQLWHRACYDRKVLGLGFANEVTI
jgi:hypothetical protein